MYKERSQFGSTSLVLALFSSALLLLAGCLNSSDDNGESTPANVDTIDVDLEEDEEKAFEVEVGEEAEYFELRLHNITEGGAFMNIRHPSGNQGTGRTEGDEGTVEFEDPQAGTYEIELRTFHHDGPASFSVTATIEPDDLTVEIVEPGRYATAKSLIPDDKGSGDGESHYPSLANPVTQVAVDQSHTTRDYAIHRDGEKIATATTHRGDTGLSLAISGDSGWLLTQAGQPLIVDEHTGNILAGQATLNTAGDSKQVRFGDETGTYHDVEISDEHGQDARQLKLDNMNDNIRITPLD